MEINNLWSRTWQVHTATKGKTLGQEVKSNSGTNCKCKGHLRMQIVIAPVGICPGRSVEGPNLVGDGMVTSCMWKWCLVHYACNQNIQNNCPLWLLLYPKPPVPQCGILEANSKVVGEMPQRAYCPCYLKALCISPTTSNIYASYNLIL